MIDPSDPVQFLERWHRDMESHARDWHGGKVWTAREGQLLREDGKVMAECPLNAVAKLTASVLLAENGSPHVVLRRIAAERETLAECKEVLAVDGWEYDDAPKLADATIRSLAKGWGWTEEVQR